MQYRCDSEVPLDDETKKKVLKLTDVEKIHTILKNYKWIGDSEIWAHLNKLSPSIDEEGFLVELPDYKIP